MFYFFVVFLVVSSSVMSFVAVPRSPVVLIGEKLELKCSVTGNDVALWTYTSWNSSREAIIYLGKDDVVTSMRSRYKIDKSISGHYNLLIDPVDLSHSGRYQCSGIQQTLICETQLTVLGSHPVCSGNTSEADVGTKEQRRLHLSIWCSVSYTGNGIPVFNWTTSNSENIASNSTTSGTGQVPFTSTSLITQQLEANDSGITFYCRITFQTTNISPENAFSGFEYTWNYTLHGPRNISIVEHEDRLECSANGNPTPTYRWTGVDSKRSIEGPVFKLDDKDQTVQCTATNVFASERKNYTMKNVLHGPRNFRIVEYEDRLECSADGNPTPIYRWTRLDTKSSMEGHVFILEGQTFQCTATNVFGSEMKNFTITKDKKSAGSIHSVERVLIFATPTVFGICLLIIGLKLRKLSIALDEVLDKLSARKSRFQPHQSSKRLHVSSSPPTDEYAEIERADASDNYCALAKEPTAAQRKEVYCELRQIEQRSLKQSTKQRVRNSVREATQP